MKEKILIYYDKKERKAVFLCDYQYCDYGVIHNSYMGYPEGYASLGKWVDPGDTKCPRCSGTGVKILYIPTL